MEIRKLTAEDAAAYWHLRLEALETEPFAFGKAAEEHRATTIEQTESRLRDMPRESFVLGGFDGQALAGIAMLARETGLKERHKAQIYGVYVTASHRHRRVGSRILATLLEEAKKDASLEQILLAVSTRQEAANKLYRKLGFEVYGIEPRALKIGSEYVDEAHMILRLR